MGYGRFVETQGSCQSQRSNLYLVVSIVQISTYSYSYIGGTKRRLYDRGTGHFVMHTAASVIADHVT